MEGVHAKASTGYHGKVFTHDLNFWMMAAELIVEIDLYVLCSSFVQAERVFFYLP